MAFVRWDPLRDLLAFQQRLNRPAPGPVGWNPAVDLLETTDRYVLIAELPGIRQEDVHIELQDGRLTISGVRREQDLACEQYHRIERGHGTFSRTFHLQAPVDADGVTADLRDGVLTVQCPKTTDGPARRIRIT